MGDMRARSEHIRDELLVMGCQEGDPRAFEELVARWQERLWRHAYRLAENQDVAYDILQEAWIAIGRGLPRLHDASAFPAWAYRIVSNKCRDWLRREYRRRKGYELYAESVNREEPGSDAAEDEDLCEHLRQALGRLSGPDRALLALKYDEGFDTAAIAEVLGIPEGTVRSRLHHTRNRLRALMEGNAI